MVCHKTTKGGYFHSTIPKYIQKGGSRMEPIVKEQILAVRDTGETNMFDVNMVAQIAMREGFYELVNYLQDHKKEYSRFILAGEEG